MPQAPTILPMLDTWLEQYAQSQKEHLSTLIQRGRLHSIKQGRWITVAPLGYLNVRRKGEARVEIDPSVALLVQQAFYFAAEGKYSSRKILHIMTERGLQSHRGKPLMVSVLQKMLTNPFYIGMMRFKNEQYIGLHQPLIEKSIFEKVQSNLAKRRKS